jgi:hypothetical protein
LGRITPAITSISDKEKKRHEEVGTLSKVDTATGSSQIFSKQITESVTADEEEFHSLPRGDEVLHLKYERAGKLVKLVDDNITIDVEFDTISSERSLEKRFGGYGPKFSIIKRLSLALSGQEVEIPTKAYSDLANINFDLPEAFFLSRTGENYYISIGGADAAESYAAIFMIQGHKLVRREVWWREGPEEETKGRIEFD